MKTCLFFLLFLFYIPAKAQYFLSVDAGTGIQARYYEEYYGERGPNPSFVFYTGINFRNPNLLVTANYSRNRGLFTNLWSLDFGVSPFKYKEGKKTRFYFVGAVSTYSLKKGELINNHNKFNLAGIGTRIYFGNLFFHQHLSFFTGISPEKALSVWNLLVGYSIPIYKKE